MKFIKDSIRELKHVVWPTRQESIKFFIVVNSILIVFGLYLFFFGSIFTNGLYALKNFVNPEIQNNNTTSNNNPVIEIWTGEAEIVSSENTEKISSWNTENSTWNVENNSWVVETGTQTISTWNVAN